MMSAWCDERRETSILERSLDPCAAASFGLLLGLLHGRSPFTIRRTSSTNWSSKLIAEMTPLGILF